MAKSYVYAWRNINNGKMNIGYKSPNGEEHTYITSLKNGEFWKDYSYGLLKKSILFVGDEKQANIAKSVEWFALDYATAVAKDRLYNPGNNASKGDDSLIPKETKKLIVDFIEGRSEGMPLLVQDEDVDFAEKLSARIKAGEFEIHQVARAVIAQYNRNQVRNKEKDLVNIGKIKTAIVEDPASARKIFGPIIVVVQANGNKMIIDGNSRFAATENMIGWEILPVVYINECEFGATELQRQDNYDLVGLYENKPSKEVKAPNTWADLKRNVVNYLVRHNYDLSKPHHVDAARGAIYSRFTSVCESKQQLNGILKSILSDFDKKQAELQYESNLLAYDEAFMARKKTECAFKDISCVFAKASEAKFMKAIGYCQHAMFNDKLNKGVIVFYYSNKSEIVEEEQGAGWIKKLKKVIKFHNLPITVEVLPAFAKN
jgi:hypothetical protein